MKTTTTESTTFDNILGFIWAVFVLTGGTYLVFFKGASELWFILICLLLGASVYHKRVVTETD
jgi:hypothetical protein